MRACDIDRRGEKAAVIPFAQKEMVDRFLYGLDDEIQREVIKFSQETVKKIGESVGGRFKFSSQTDKKRYQAALEAAETAYINSLREDAFTVIRSKSRRTIEDIVEFMPKPEMARMAEALVELTSIKRRVSRGMETVREPIDVAVISRSEGFIWVKRKHYFEAELNPRYAKRLREVPSARDVP
jgi:hypothetical protein